MVATFASNQVSVSYRRHWQQNKRHCPSHNTDHEPSVSIMASTLANSNTTVRVWTRTLTTAQMSVLWRRHLLRHQCQRRGLYFEKDISVCVLAATVAMIPAVTLQTLI